MCNVSYPGGKEMPMTSDRVSSFQWSVHWHLHQVRLQRANVLLAACSREGLPSCPSESAGGPPRSRERPHQLQPLPSTRLDSTFTEVPEPNVPSPSPKIGHRELPGTTLQNRARVNRLFCRSTQPQFGIQKSDKVPLDKMAKVF